MSRSKRDSWLRSDSFIAPELSSRRISQSAVIVCARRDEFPIVSQDDRGILASEPPSTIRLFCHGLKVLERVLNGAILVNRSLRDWPDDLAARGGPRAGDREFGVTRACLPPCHFKNSPGSPAIK
jgi:hypothetical protein